MHEIEFIRAVMLNTWCYAKSQDSRIQSIDMSPRARAFPSRLEWLNVSRREPAIGDGRGATIQKEKWVQRLNRE